MKTGMRSAFENLESMKLSTSSVAKALSRAARSLGKQARECVSLSGDAQGRDFWLAEAREFEKGVSPRDVHLLLNTGRAPVLKLEDTTRWEGRVPALSFSMREFLVTALLWRLNHGFPSKPSLRKKVVEVLRSAKAIDRVVSGGENLILVVNDRSAEVMSDAQFGRVAWNGLTNFPLREFFKEALDAAESMLQEPKKQPTRQR